MEGESLTGDCAVELCVCVVWYTKFARMAWLGDGVTDAWAEGLWPLTFLLFLLRCGSAAVFS